MRLILILLLSLCLVSPACFASVDFDGADDSVQFSSALLSATPISISCWFNANNVTAGHTIFSLADKDVSNHYFRMAAQGNAGGDPLRCDTSGGIGSQGFADTTTGYSASTWHHAACVFASDNSRSSYIDGGSKATESTSGVAVSGEDSTWIGGRAWDLSTQPMYGQVTECAVWSSALTDAEVLLLASSRVKRLPLQIQPENLVMYLPMDDEADGTSTDTDTFTDMSGNGNNATGVDGTNNTGLTAKAEQVLSYP